MHKHPTTRPSIDSFEFVGGLDVARLEFDVVPETLLFFRKEACELWDALDTLQSSPSKCRLVVEGSPGVGKSTEVWAWLSCQYALQRRDGIFSIWIHLDTEAPARIVLFVDKKCIYWTTMLDSEIDAFIKSDLGDNVRYLVLDGVCSTHKQIISLMLWKIEKVLKCCQLITVMSIGVKRNPCKDDLFKVDVYWVNPWSLEQYQAACKNVDFWRGIKNKFAAVKTLSTGNVIELVEKKFYYAGGSARWMFALPHERLLVIIAYHISRVGNVQHLLSGRVGENSLASSNNLMSRYKVGILYLPFIASKFVASLLLSKSESSVYKIAYSLASQQSNPAFLGWIVEFDFISQMRQCSVQTNLFELVNGESQGAGIQWHVPALLDFDPESYDAPMMPVGSWLKPVKWNQEGYDLMGLFEDQGQHYLRFVQITNADKHIVNMKVFQKSLEKAKDILCIDLGVEIIVVSPLARIKSPTIIDVKNQKALSKVSVGSTAETWKGTSGGIISSIKFLFFDQQI